MSKERALKIVESTRVVTVVRGVEQSRIAHVAEALHRGGICAMEVTLDTPDALEMIQELQQRMGQDMLIGAGTVIDVGDAKQAVQAGASFLVTPNTEPAVIRYAVEQNIPIIVGAITPTEIVTAWQAGASAIKLYPIGTLGIGYIKELRAPLRHIPLIPFGGVHAHNVAEYLAIGCYAVGVNSAVIDLREIAAGQYDQIAEKATRLTAEVRQFMETNQTQEHFAY